MPIRWKRTEAEVAEPVVQWLEDAGWEVFQEVTASFQGPVYDIVAKRDTAIWVIEVKTRFSAEVVAQAWNAKGLWHGNRFSVATPPLRYFRSSKVQQFLKWVCQDQGIGIIEVQLVDDLIEPHFKVTELVTARPDQRCSRNFADKLHESQKDYAKAGNAKGKRWSPFQQSCMNLTILARGMPGMRINDLVKCFRHHYQTDSAATGSLRKWVEMKKIRGIFGRWEDWGKRGRRGYEKTYRIYPVDVDGSK